MFTQEILYQNVANCFRSYREFSTLTISELATLLNISPGELENIEQELTRPCLYTMFKFSLLFCVSMDHLCMDIPPKHKVESSSIDDLARKRKISLMNKSEMALIPIFKNKETEYLFHSFLENPESSVFKDFHVMLSLFIYHLSFPDTSLEIDKVFEIDKMIARKCVQYRNQHKKVNRNKRSLIDLFSLCKNELIATRLIIALEEIELHEHT